MVTIAIMISSLIIMFTIFSRLIEEQNFPDSFPQLGVVEIGGLEITSSFPQFINGYQNLLLYENSNSLKFYQIRLIPEVYSHCEQT